MFKMNCSLLRAASHVYTICINAQYIDLGSLQALPLQHNTVIYNALLMRF